MTITKASLAVFLALFAVGARAASQRAQRAVQGWPEPNKQAAMAMIDKYGQPDTTSPDRLEWTNRGPFKRIAVDGLPGASGIVENTVAYPVPSGAGLLSLKEGYVYPNPEAAELTSYGGSEQENVLALNTADDVLCGRLDAGQAHARQERTIRLQRSGKSSTAAERLQFRPGVDPLWDYVHTIQD
jgi:hypothetical protein